MMIFIRPYNFLAYRMTRPNVFLLVCRLLLTPFQEIFRWCAEISSGLLRAHATSCKIHAISANILPTPKPFIVILSSLRQRHRLHSIPKQSSPESFPFTMKKAAPPSQAKPNPSQPPPKRTTGQHLPSLTAAYATAFLLSFLPLVAVIYALRSNCNLALFERESNERSTIEKYTAILQNREVTFQRTHRRVLTLEGSYERSQRTITELRREMADAERAHEYQIREYKSKLDEALARVKSLEGNVPSCDLPSEG